MLTAARQILVNENRVLRITPRFIDLLFFYSTTDDLETIYQSVTFMNLSLGL